MFIGIFRCTLGLEPDLSSRADCFLESPPHSPLLSGALGLRFVRNTIKQILPAFGGHGGSLWMKAPQSGNGVD